MTTETDKHIRFVLLDCSKLLLYSLPRSATQSMLIVQDSRKQVRMALDTHFSN
ncbi:hypothetical protein Hanom_Chr04g00362981 [Helianthus anomalus]